MKNSKKILSDFGDEWEKFNQFDVDKDELLEIYKDYFFVNPGLKNLCVKVLI